MSVAASEAVAVPAWATWVAVGIGGAVLAALGLTGAASAALGYGLLSGAMGLIVAGIAAFSVLAFSRYGNAMTLASIGRVSLVAGGIAYLLGVFALAGHFGHETLQGRMEWHWILFGPLALAALVVLDYGLYRKLVVNNLPTWRRYRMYIRREDAEPEAMRATFVDEVLLHRALWRTSKVRWVRHSLIFWGFAWMFVTELVAVFLREVVPAFGWRDIWREPEHPVRMTFDFVFDFTGLMVIAGCLLALAWRWTVGNGPDRKYADTPTTLFLLFVVVSGFVVEGWRIAGSFGDPSHGASFVGIAFAYPVQALGLDAAAYKPLWLVHVIAACAFIAYVPLKRLVHTCATPLGRLMNSQKGLLAAKKRGVLGAMLLRKGGISSAMTETSHGR